MSTCPAVSAQKSGEPAQARISPVALSSTTAAACRAPRSASVSTAWRTSPSSSSWSGRSSEVRSVPWRNALALGPGQHPSRKVGGEERTRALPLQRRLFAARDGPRKAARSRARPAAPAPGIGAPVRAQGRPAGCRSRERARAPPAVRPAPGLRRRPRCRSRVRRPPPPRRFPAPGGSGSGTAPESPACPRWRSRRRAQSAWRTLPLHVRGVGASMRASCIVIVEPPETIRPARRLDQAARAAARRSTPWCRWNR